MKRKRLRTVKVKNPADDDWTSAESEYKVIEVEGVFYIRNLTVRQTFDASFRTEAEAEAMIANIKAPIVRKKLTKRHAGATTRKLF